MQRRLPLLLWLAAALGALGAWGILALWTPPGGADHSICLFRRATGIPCPGCGMTRAFACLAKGDLAGALRLHPLVPLLAVEVASAWTLAGLLLFGSRAAGALLDRGRRALPDLLVAHALVLAFLWLGRLASGTVPF